MVDMQSAVTVVGVLSVTGAVAWIGLNVSRIIDSHAALQRRVRAGEDFAHRVDAASSKRCRNLEARQDRLQSLVEHAGKDWRDSRLLTEVRHSGITEIDLKKPWRDP